MSGTVTETYAYYPFTTTGNVLARPGVMAGITVATAGNLAVYDSNASSTSITVLTTTAVTAGQFLALPCGLNQGCYIVTTATGTAWLL